LRVAFFLVAFLRVAFLRVAFFLFLAMIIDLLVSVLTRVRTTDGRSVNRVVHLSGSFWKSLYHFFLFVRCLHCNARKVIVLLSLQKHLRSCNTSGFFVCAQRKNFVLFTFVSFLFFYTYNDFFAFFLNVKFFCSWCNTTVLLLVVFTK
jgi:hypothetical protein